MGRILFLLVACAVGLQGAPAADSIAGTVYREQGAVAALRILWQHTIIFGNDGRYIFLKAVAASPLNGNWRIETPPDDGTYVYTRTGPTTGTATFSNPDVNRVYGGSTLDGTAALMLDFDDTTILGGDAGSGAFVQTAGGRGFFSLTKMSGIQREPLINVSMRGVVSPDRPLIVGFVIQGDPKDVLIRVVGPSLRVFGITDAWANPRFDIYGSHSSFPIGGEPGPMRDAIAYHDDWSGDSRAVPGLLKLFAHVGAFQLETGSRDAVGVTPRLVRGAYTVVCTSDSNDAGGVALVEVYVLP